MKMIDTEPFLDRKITLGTEYLQNTLSPICKKKFSFYAISLYFCAIFSA